MKFDKLSRAIVRVILCFGNDGCSSWTIYQHINVKDIYGFKDAHDIYYQTSFLTTVERRLRYLSQKKIISYNRKNNRYCLTCFGLEQFRTYCAESVYKLQSHGWRINSKLLEFVGLPLPLEVVV